MAAPESRLPELLAGLSAQLRPGRYVFATCAVVPGGVQVLASVVEPEGPSLVMSQEDADRAGLAYDFVAAWITVGVPSALHAVGLTAAVSTALAGAGVSCNVIAGRHHDHLLVPDDRAQDALGVLRELARSAASPR